MRQRSALLAVTVSGLVVLSACSQSGQTVKVHSYGVNVSSASLGMHTFRSGETLWSIAQRYDVDLRDLLEINRLTPPYAIASGTRVRIPAPRAYTVRQGDTLYNISRLFNSTTTELARLNRLPAPYKVSAGQKLRIPATSGRSAAYASVASSAPIAIPPSKPTWFGTPPSGGAEQTGRASAASGIQSEPLPPQAQTQAQSQTQAQASAAVSAQNPDQAPVLASGADVPPPARRVADAPPPPLSGSGFIAPVSGPILSAYGVKPDGLHNDGVNIQAARGTPVRASESGTVAYVGDAIEGYGKLILIRHSGGYITAYAHLDKMLVKKGARVQRGEAIGTVGSTGRVSSPQLHFEIRKGKDALDPARYIRI